MSIVVSCCVNCCEISKLNRNEIRMSWGRWLTWGVHQTWGLIKRVKEPQKWILAAKKNMFAANPAFAASDPAYPLTGQIPA